MADPWLKFYTGDWRSDPKLRMCSMAARGLWIEMICLMHEAEPYGHLVINGRAPTAIQLAGLVGAAVDDVEKWIEELRDAGVFSVTKGRVIYSRKLHMMENRARKSRENGKKGGNPSLGNKMEKSGQVNLGDNQPDNPQKLDTRYTDTSLRSVSDAAGVDLPPDFDDLEGVEPFELPQPIRQPRPVDPPPPPQPERPTLGLRDVLFRQGRAFFAAHGKTESAAAGMIARWLKDFDEATVLAAISAAEKERAVEPVSWINAHLQRQAKRSRGEFPQSRPPPEATRVQPSENWRCGARIASNESVIPPPLKRPKGQ